MKTLRILVLLSVGCLIFVPFLVIRSHAERGAISKKKIPDLSAARTTMLAPAPTGPSQQQSAVSGPAADAAPVSPEVYAKFGLGPSAADQGTKAPGISPEANIPINMSASAPFSAGIATAIGKGFLEVDTLGDWDGKEDDTADHGGKVMDATNVPIPAANPNFFVTRVAFSAHTIANGFPEDIFYAGDSLGNIYVASTTNITAAAPTPTVLTVNLPTVLNAFGTLNSNNTITITGLALSPVCELGSFARVNGAFGPDFPTGTIGEILYVSFEDTGGGFRLLANGTLIRSGVLAFPISDVPTPGPAAPPGRVSSNPFPVTVGGAFGVQFSVFSNLAGVAVDDDGSIYLQQVDLAQFTGANIVKITGVDGSNPTPNQDRSLATSGFFTLTTLSPSNGQYGTASGPANQISRATNYSGKSFFIGNLISIATGPGNVVYGAMARSLNNADDAATQATEGLFANEAALGATPSMIITFADARGSFDTCSSANFMNPSLTGVIPNADGIADPVAPGAGVPNWRAFVLGNGPDNRAASGTNAAVFGTPTNTLKLDMPIDYSVYSGLTVNEDGTVYVIAGGAPSGVGNNPSSNRGEILCFEDNRPGDRRADYIDFRGDLPPNPPSSGGPNVGDGDSDRFDHIFYVAPLDVSTLTPAGLTGLARGFLRYTNRLAPKAISPGVTLGLTAGQVATVAPAAGGAGYAVNNVLTLTTGGTGATVQVTSVGGAGDVTGVTLLTVGSGYADGVSATTGGAGAGATITITVTPSQRTQGDDSHDGPILFDALDPSHQVAGGDDQVFPFTGDDNDGAGSPPLAGPLSGGFEFLFANPLGDVFTVGAACGPGNGVWNGFFLNSNGNITFGAGDDDNSSTTTELRSGLPRIAPAWGDLNPNARATTPGTFPVQAVGFTGPNAFKVRYINVPEFGSEGCSAANPQGAGLANTFSVTLYDDGTGIDENANQPLNPANPIGNNAVPFDLLEGSTDSRFVKEPNTGQVVGEKPRPDGSGFFIDSYARMDLLGTTADPITVGYSIGLQSPVNPPGSCAIDLGSAAVTADTGFGNIQGQTEVRWPTFIGDGTEPEIHEIFNKGVAGSVDGGTGIVTPSKADFDLRFEGNGDATPASSVNPADLSRDRAGFNGTTCQLPSNPQISQVLANPFVTTPTTSPNSLINAYAPVTINLLGTGFFANEVTTLCPAGSEGAPRPGKTVSTAVVVTFDTNADGVPDLPLALTNIIPVSRNLITATAAPLPNASGTGPGSPWPFNAPGGNANTATATTTFTRGDNNIFNLVAAPNAFTRAATASVPDMGARAPIVVTSSPSTGDSAIVQNLTITGFGFQYLTTTNIPVQPPPNPPLVLRPFNVTAVFAVQRDNPANVIQATSFNVLNNTTLNAVFNFNGVPGSQFLIFVQNAAGASRNALTAPGGASPNGNEQGNLILFTVTDTTPPTITCPANVSVNLSAGQTSAAVTYPAPVATDNQPGVVVSCDRASGSTFNLGTTLVTCTATDTSNNTASCSFNVTLTGSNSMHFSAATYTGAEGCTSALITIQRDNPTGSASVDVATSDGTAVQKNDYGFTAATVTFNAGETSKTVSVPINDDGFVEGPETVNLTLSNPQNGVAGNGPVLATLTITDDDLVPPAGNVNDTAATFVCQHYHDFLNRDPDPAGAAFWTSQITNCGANAACIAATRVSVSASFFLSIEFQETGGDVLRVQRVAFGRRSNSALTRYPYAQYMRDAQQVGRGVIVGQAGYQALLDANKSAYVTQIVTSSAFITLFPTSQTAATYVDALFASAGVTPTTAERNAAIAAFGGGGTAGRAAALQSVADANSVRSAEFNAAFVLMEYYGYLRRNPTDPPDNNDNGYQFWLTKLNAFNGNFIDSEMVKAFLTSIEYRQRFGP